MFESIINWMIANKDSLISGVIGNGIFLGVVQLWILKNKIPKVIKTLANIKGIKYLGFIVLYILPLGTIASMIIDKTNEPTFKNIGLFIIICVSFVYNLLMSHIINLYKMNTKLTNISMVKLTKINQTFDKIYYHIEKTKSDNNLK